MKKKLLVLLVAFIAFSCTRIDKHDVECKILSIDKQVETRGNKNSIHTDIYWLVTTDSGVYVIETDGLWPCANAVGKLKVDSTYILTIDGWFQSDFFGVYPNIVNVKDK